MVAVIVVVRRLDVDHRVHPGMDAAFEEMDALAESFDPHAVTGGNDGSDGRGAFWTGRQSQGHVQGSDASTAKRGNLGKGVVFTAAIADAYLLVGLNHQKWSVEPPS